MPIFNIFGHTPPVEFGVEIEESYVNVDTGCYANEYGYGELSAYCVETGEVVAVNRRLEESTMIIVPNFIEIYKIPDEKRGFCGGFSLHDIYGHRRFLPYIKI